MSAAANSIFAKIVAGDLPCHKVYEDDHTLAFLDINPLATGHTLVIPKTSATTIGELSDEANAALGRAVGIVARMVIGVTGAPGYNVLQNNNAVAGQEVPYVHYHIIPRSAGDGLGFRWVPQQRSQEELVALRDKIIAAADAR